MRAVWFVLIVVQLNWPSFGQPSQLSFQHLNIKDGLTARYNDFIFKDSRGLVWISSTEGLYCYDGIRMEHYEPGKANGQGMLGRNIQSRFFEDQSSNIWFATVEGINCYERTRHQFSHFQLRDRNQKPIDGDYGLFHLEQNRYLWIKTNGQIYRYDIQSPESNAPIIAQTKGVRFAVNTLPDGRVNQIFSCFWDGDSGFERIVINPDGTVNTQAYLTDGWPVGTGTQIEVSGAIVQNHKNVWLFSDHGLLQFTQNDQIIQHALPPGHTNTIKDGAVLDDRYLFLAGKGSGLWLFDTQRQKFTQQYQYQGDDPESLISDDLREVYVDQQDHIWLASRASAEIDQAWLYANRFTNPMQLDDNQLPLLQFIVEDLQQRIWCATANDGVFVFDLSGQLHAHFPYTKESTSGTRPFEMVQQISVDQQGKVWAVSNQWIYGFSEKEQKWQEVYYSGDKKLTNLIHLATPFKLISTNKGVFQLQTHAKTTEMQLGRKVAANDRQQVLALKEGAQHIYIPFQDGTLLVYQKTKPLPTLVQQIDIEAEA
ncbi:MAG: hypothetical protein AAGD05_11650, partial [Bacteroidota bacterium]